VLVVCALLAPACGGGDDTKPVPSANVDQSKRFCDALTSATASDADLEKAVPDALKDDFEKWRTGNDPEKTHVGRLNEYAHKACGVPFDEPGFTTTTTGATSTSATVTP
jgi:hypothetical protein